MIYDLRIAHTTGNDISALWTVHWTEMVADDDNEEDDVGYGKHATDTCKHLRSVYYTT